MFCNRFTDEITMAGPVLILEDDPDICSSTRLKRRLLIPVSPQPEKKASASLDRVNPPSIILLDLLLPGMKGTELCRRLRVEPSTSSTPIVVITAKAFEVDLNASLALGANDYIVKPFSVRDVVARLQSLLNQNTPAN